MRGRTEDRSERVREAVRVSVGVHVRYRFDTREEFAAATAVDVSASGVFVPFEGKQGAGAMVELEVEWPKSGKPLHGFGRVARLGNCPDGKPGMGVQFVSFDEQDLELIEEFVSVAAELEKAKAGAP